jgi:tetratricopeptide (TPR) repeat protein
MQSLKPQSVLTPEERSQKRKILIRDAVALLTLLVITAALFTATLFLFRSFSNLRSRLGKRWLTRGEAALHSDRPDLAVEDLRSALAYSPGQRSIEIELAEALAAAGRTQEAISYFNTLWEAEPGNGTINLQLARLAVKQKNQTAALENYRASIYGTWEGDGTIRRREVRLELIDYLISIGHFDEARSELLIALGNAPDDPKVKLDIAALMEKAGDPFNAAEIYKTTLRHSPPNLVALLGAGRTTLEMGHFAEARNYLQKTLAQPGAASELAQQLPEIHDLLNDAVQTLLLYPSPALSQLAQAERTLKDRNLAHTRLNECLTDQPDQAQKPEIAAVLARWQLENPKLGIPELKSNPALRGSELQLVYDTEQAADKYCGTATGDNARLSRIAANPGAVETE